RRPLHAHGQQPQPADGSRAQSQLSRRALSERRRAEDERVGLLKDAGKRMPFVDKWLLSLEKEAIPNWNKFLQGYYDVSSISSDNFDQVIQLSGTGDPQLTPAMERQGIRLQTSVAPTIGYIGFNMLDPVVGGDSERARKLRQAISIAIDEEESISI